MSVSLNIQQHSQDWDLTPSSAAVNRAGYDGEYFAHSSWLPWAQRTLFRLWSLPPRKVSLHGALLAWLVILGWAGRLGALRSSSLVSNLCGWYYEIGDSRNVVAAAAGLGSTIGASIVVDFDRFQELKAVRNFAEHFLGDKCSLSL